jgi:hypothetical protein
MEALCKHQESEVSPSLSDRWRVSRTRRESCSITNTRRCVSRACCLLLLESYSLCFLSQLHLSADYVLQQFQQSKSSPAPSPTGKPLPAPTSILDPKVNTSFSQDIAPDNSHAAAKREIKGVLVHEIVHALQCTGKDTCPGGLIEGIADWVRLQSDLAPPHWKEKPDNWEGVR